MAAHATVPASRRKPRRDAMFLSDRIASNSTAMGTIQAHHRGQLTVYLRLNDERVPGIYGPSADEVELHFTCVQGENCDEG